MMAKSEIIIQAKLTIYYKLFKLAFWVIGKISNKSVVELYVNNKKLDFNLTVADILKDLLKP